MIKYKVNNSVMEKYCAVKYKDSHYYQDHPVLLESLSSLQKAHLSKRSPEKFFRTSSKNARGKINNKVEDIVLLEDKKWIYALRGDTIFTIFSVHDVDSDLALKSEDR